MTRDYEFFPQRAGELCAEQVPLREIAARFGTPCYVYSRAAFETTWRKYDRAFGARRHSIHYAVKANGSLAVLNLLARLGSGFDIVSGGELARVQAAGGDPAKVVFSGVGKSVEEMRLALAAGTGMFNLESPTEMARLDAVAGGMGLRPRVAIRVNPDVDARTHPYISTGLNENKFGVPMAEAFELYRRAAALPNIDVAGVACHIGSQLTELSPFADALSRVMALVAQLADAGIPLRHIDAGGGLGIRYRDETPPAIEDYVDVLCRVIPEQYEICIEPGRSICGPAGLLLSRVEYLKATPTHRFAICDASMTELIRPALYEAWHDVVEVDLAATGVPVKTYDLVGPVCETGDFLASGRELRVAEGSLVAIMCTGAYGYVMSSNYNARPRPPEVLVDGAHCHLAKPREQVAALFADECVLPNAPE